MHFPDPQTISSREFELTVKRWFDSFASSVESFESKHREISAGRSGNYEIDVSIRFTAFGGAKFYVICECKKHNYAIKRETVQILRDRKESLGAHKAFLVTTARFQSGAVEYAKDHGIALVEIANGALAYIQASVSVRPRIPDVAEPYVGFAHGDNSDGWFYPTLISSSYTYGLEHLLKSDG